MSASPLKADITRIVAYVRFVPDSDVYLSERRNGIRTSKGQSPDTHCLADLKAGQIVSNFERASVCLTCLGDKVIDRRRWCVFRSEEDNMRVGSELGLGALEHTNAKSFVDRLFDHHAFRHCASGTGKPF